LLQLSSAHGASELVRLNTSLLAEETGIHIGDGSMGMYERAHNKKVYRCTVSGHSVEDKDYLLNYVRPLLSTLYGVNVYTSELKTRKTLMLGYESRRVVLFKHDVLALPIGKKTRIRIPDVFLDNISLAKLCLRGLFDTDGGVAFRNWKRRSYSYPVVHFTSTSLELVSQVSELLESLNIRHELLIQPGTRLFKAAGRIRIYGKNGLERWLAEVGFRNPANISKILLWRREGHCAPGSSVVERMGRLNSAETCASDLRKASSIEGRRRDFPIAKATF